MAVLSWKELMADTDPKVISCAVLAYKECYADHLELLHGHFRRYCRIIKQLDSWSQSYLIELLIKYCKQYLPKPTVVDKSSEGSPRSCPLPDKYNEIEYPSYEVVNDPDLDLFLQSLNCLIYSSNPTVILSCCNALYQLASPLQMKNTKFIEALVRTVTMTENQGNKEMLLQAIHFLSILDQTLFLPYTKKFYVFPKDPIVASIWKIQISLIQQEVYIDDNYVGNVIGKGGKHINSIKETTGCSIQIDDHVEGCSERKILIRGTPIGSQTAILLINNKIEMDRRNKQSIGDKLENPLSS